MKLDEDLHPNIVHQAMTTFGSANADITVSLFELAFGQDSHKITRPQSSTFNGRNEQDQMNSSIRKLQKYMN
jgi:hypothetical protein